MCSEVPNTHRFNVSFNMDDKAYALPPSSRVLVTGANGYLASQIIDLLLSRGYLVRGQVRQHRQWLDEHFKGKYGDLFESVILSELDDREGIAPLLDDVAGVILVVWELSWYRSGNGAGLTIVRQWTCPLKMTRPSSRKQ